MLSISQRRSLQKRFSEKKEQTQGTKNQDGDPAVIEEEGYASAVVYGASDIRQEGQWIIMPCVA